jgi:hypothetical protein
LAMSVHPLSLRTRILLEFPDVRDARFEWIAHETRFFLVASPDVRVKVGEMLNRHAAMTALVSVDPEWVPGPPWPALFDAFTESERELFESCDSTKGGLETVLLQVCPWASDVKVTTVAGGHIRVTIQSRSGTTPSEALLARCKEAAHAASPVGAIKVDVVAGLVPADESGPSHDPKVAELTRLLQHASSRHGLVDPRLCEIFTEDEDYYRDARERGFPPKGPADDKAGILLPPIPPRPARGICCCSTTASTSPRPRTPTTKCSTASAAMT